MSRPAHNALSISLRSVSVKDRSRFWSKVKKSGGCWIWKSNKYHCGYGMFRLNGRKVGAHRLAFVLSGGKLPDGLCVCHDCDVRACVNPAHLFRGTHRDNMLDMASKGHRFQSKSPGEKNGQAKLTVAKVRRIRRLVSGGKSQAAVSRKYRVSESTIRFICRRQRWAHVK